MNRCAVVCLLAVLVPVAAQEGPPVLRRKPTESDKKAEPAKPESTKSEPAKSEPAKKDAPAPGPEDTDTLNYPTTQHPVKAAPDSRDPGAPKLRRGPPPARPKTPDTPEPDPEPLPPVPAPAASATGGSPATPPVRPPAPLAEVETDAEGRVEKVNRSLPSMDDPLIEKAREFAAEYVEKLPNFVCDQLTSRSQSVTLKPDWKFKDRYEVELVWLNGKEDYRNVRMNGKALKKGSPMDSGQWSTGEFGTIIADLFQPSTRAAFKLRSENSSAAGIPAKVYDFSVQQANSHWEIRMGRSIRPAYRGAVWIDPKEGRVLRIEMNTRSLPSDYEVDKVETTVDYGFVKIGTERYLLPVQSANLSCQRGTYNCAMNELEFRNYRKFSVESQVLATDSEISFPEADDPKKPKSETTPPSLTDPKPPPASAKKKK